MRHRTLAPTRILGAFVLAIALGGAAKKSPPPPSDYIVDPYDSQPQKLLDDICSKTRILQDRLGWENNHQTYLDLGDILALACRKRPYLAPLGPLPPPKR
jgi:hypothetical protein